MAIEITVCVGSSCHVRGSRDMLKRFAEIIKADERISDREISFFNGVSDSLGLTPAQLMGLYAD